MIRYPKKTVALAALFVMFLVHPATAQEKQLQTQQVSVTLDTFTRLFSILATVLTFCIGILQLYITNRVNKAESFFKEEIASLRFENSQQLQQKVDQRIEKLEAKMATKEDIANIRDIVKLGLQNMELQIKTSYSK